MCVTMCLFDLQCFGSSLNKHVDARCCAHAQHCLQHVSKLLFISLTIAFTYVLLQVSLFTSIVFVGSLNGTIYMAAATLGIHLNVLSLELP